MKISACLLAALLVVGPTWAAASNDLAAPAVPAGTSAQAVSAAPADAPAAAATCDCIPAGSMVELEIGELLSSATRTRGEKFPITLHAPVARDGAVLIPAGISGMGEIVHADRSHGGGKPGELLIAARYLDLAGTQVPLRGLQFGGQGKDKTNLAIGTAMAIGVFAQFIHGKEIEIPAGTVVSAKLAKDFPLSAVAPADAAASMAPALPTTTQHPQSTKE